MKYKCVVGDKAKNYHFRLKDNNDIDLLGFGHVQMETRPRTNGQINGLDVYTVIDAMKQRVIRMYKKRPAANKREVIHYLNLAEEAMRKCKDNRVFRGDEF